MGCDAAERLRPVLDDQSTRVIADVKGYIPLGPKNRILALRLRTSHSLDDENDEVPFYLMETLGALAGEFWRMLEGALAHPGSRLFPLYILSSVAIAYGVYRVTSENFRTGFLAWLAPKEIWRHPSAT